MIQKNFDTYSNFVRYINNLTMYNVFGKLSLSDEESKVYLETLLATLADIVSARENNEVFAYISWLDWGVFFGDFKRKNLQAKMKITFRYKENGFWYDCLRTELITDENCAMKEKDFEL